ncbi:glycosyltransferase family 2 protein [Phocaeicola sartorii]|jgi:glycosyltransferase, family 2|uniref:glycosyltransferase family 2 protein n=1 Tax=Phocaeicola sartorii TaxID=671267 RepID=UPI00351252C5
MNFAKDENIKVSIIIATYNSGKVLCTALDSCLSQTVSDIEIIVVDGGSEDATLAILEEYSCKDKRIKYLSESDKGIYDALNKGVNMAKGEWIYVLGSDDKLLSDGLETLINVSDNADIVYGDLWVKHADGSLKYFKSKQYHLVRHIMFCCHQSMIMKRKMMLKMNCFNVRYPIRADFDLTLRCYLEGYNLKYVHKPVAYFFSEGLSGTAPLSNDWERYHILKSNKSTNFPFLWFSWYLLKKMVRNVLNKIR